MDQRSRGKSLYCALVILFLTFSTACQSASKDSEPKYSKEIEEAWDEFGISLITAYNPIFSLASRELTKGDLWFLVEVPAGSYLKKEFRTTTAQLFVDREICKRPLYKKEGAIKGFPASYGITSGLFSGDGDPLDLLVLGSEEIYQELGAKNVWGGREVRVIGLVQMEECHKVPCKKQSQWENDWKVLAVDIDDDKYSKINAPSDLGKEKLEEISDFFASYKGLKKGHPKARVAGYKDRKAALKYIASFKKVTPAERIQEVRFCIHHYEKVIAKNASILKMGKPALDKTYLQCLKKVFYPGFMKDPLILNFYKKYSAYQLIKYHYKDNNVTISNALTKMAQRRAKRKKHFRFVGFDIPAPGTGKAIFEWVKTKDRSKGCPKPVKKQHYESRPLVDHDGDHWF